MAESIPFNRPVTLGTELDKIAAVFANQRFADKGEFVGRCARWFKETHAAEDVLMTPSCTHALEAAALLCEIGPGDEVILPSFAFTTTATAFARCGASLVFVDIRPETMNIDPECVAAAITDRTKVIVALHYGGVTCDMDALCALADEHGIALVEDAAQAILCTYKDRPAGTFGGFGCFSFHETKNIQCGEGGALFVNDPAKIPAAEIVWEKGSNRSSFIRGEVDKYTWMGLGSSYAMSEVAAAFLYAQLEQAEAIIADRLRTWSVYADALGPLAGNGAIALPHVPSECRHNGHVFYIKTADEAERDALQAHLRDRSIQAVFHYIPLHSAPEGRRRGRFAGEDQWTTRESARLLRLPLYYGMSEGQALEVVDGITDFYASDVAKAQIRRTA